MDLTADDIRMIIQEQQNYYFSGETKDVEFRKKMLRKLYDAINRYEDEITEALYKDLGKSSFESYATEIGFVLSSISHMLKSMDEWLKPEQVKTPVHLQPAKSFIVRDPYGVVLIIAPFNYPFQLMIEPLVGAIVGGNCAIIKPSEFALNTSKVIRKVIEEIFPPHFVSVVEGEREVTSHLIHAPFDYIFFTGSVAVGKIVMKAAAESLTPVTLELGGKSPTIVDPTANLSHAAERIVWGKFLNTGQTCVAPDYVLVHKNVKKPLIKNMVKVIKKFYSANPIKSPDYGRIINQRHFERLTTMIEKESSDIVYGGRYDEKALFIEPTLIEKVHWDSPSMEEEIFGPLLPILEYENLGEAIHQIRQNPKPLAAYMFTENEQAANYFMENLPFGGGCINDTVSHVGNIHLPFGGVGASGVNAYHGKASYELFTHAKSMMQRNTKIPMKLAYPPYKNKLNLIKPFIR